MKALMDIPVFVLLTISSCLSLTPPTQKAKKPNLDFYNGLLKKYNLELPIWVTEFGTYSGVTQRRGTHKSHKFQSEVFQASWYIKYTLFAMARGVTLITPDLYSYCNDNTSVILADDFDSQSGGYISSEMVQSYIATLSYYVHKLYSFILINRTEIEEIRKATYDEGIYRITKSNGDVFYVAWGSGGFDMLTGEVTVIDIYGNISVMDAGSIRLSPNAPLIITKREIQQ